jgi:uncharacterized membrane protein (UPF0127 family)
MQPVTRLLTITSLSIVLFVLAQFAFADQAQETLPSTTLIINGHALETELAVSSRQRYMGLSFRKQLKRDAGMLFVYSREDMLVFTMRNTLIPLSIAFISADMTINEIHKMNVGPDQLFPAKKPARYALEVNQGWFAANGIKPGDKITLE